MRRLPPMTGKLPTFEITCFADLYEFAAANETLIFRGVTDAANHKLVPTVGRTAMRRGKPRGPIESRIFRLFKERALPHLEFQPRNEWEWLAIAQHHGLPTRLLDWTYNPLVACYFAVEKVFNEQSAIWAFNCQAMVDTEKELSASPFKITKVMRYRPPHVAPRIIAQNGCFTCHPEPEKPLLWESRMQVGLIAPDCRKKLKDDLYTFGVNASTLFPGLDGLAKELEWRHTDGH